jgi:hypothetical protein
MQAFPDDFVFSWPVPDTGGFLWREQNGALLLVEAEGTTFRYYHPLRQRTALYRTFADTDPSPEAALRFANLYGALLSPVWPEAKEDFSRWKKEIVWMREAVRLWELAKEGKEEELSRCIRRKGQLVYYDPPASVWKEFGFTQPWSKYPRAKTQGYEGADILTQAGLPADAVEKGDVVRPAWLLLWLIINGRMAQDVSPVGVFHLQRGASEIRHRPKTLHGALWLRLALAVCGDHQGQRCEVCGSAFDLAPGENRIDRRTCSATCRTKLYLLRKKRAQQLRADGWALKRIAKEVGSDVNTVKKWLSQD